MHGPVLWKMADEVRCVLLQYDEERYQLKLMRAFGTIKADLSPTYDSALAAARIWLQQLNASLADAKTPAR